MKASDFGKGDAVRYIPGVARGNPNHDACENGIVSSQNGLYVFVKYFSDRQNGNLEMHAKATSPEDLVKT